MTNKINEIASKHLGRAGDGSIVKPYVTPDHIDNSLLVAVPRIDNRVEYNIDESNLPFVGFDVWNAYEVSALTDNGFPVTGIAKIVYPCHSPSIVESKSLKLYLNSFNMDRLGTTVKDVRETIEKTVQRDLSSLLETDVKVSFFTVQDKGETGAPKGFDTVVEHVVDCSALSFEHYNEDPNILQYKDTKGKEYKLYCGLLRSNCRVTNQPDWGSLYIEIIGDRAPTYESLIQYIVSMRKENHFHEEVLECIYKRLYDALPGAQIAVGALYTRRGGIDINPIRATDSEMLASFVDYIDHNRVSIKTINQ